MNQLNTFISIVVGILVIYNIFISKTTTKDEFKTFKIEVFDPFKKIVERRLNAKSLQIDDHEKRLTKIETEHKSNHI